MKDLMTRSEILRGTVDSRIRYQLQVADLALTLAESIDPSAVIAGGAPRDWAFKRAANDIDIFLSVSPNVRHSDFMIELERAFSIPRDNMEVLGLNYGASEEQQQEDDGPEFDTGSGWVDPE